MICLVSAGQMGRVTASIYIYILQLRQFGGFYHLIYPLGMCSSAAVVSYHTDARVTLSGKNTEVYPSLTNIYPRAPGFQTYWHGGIKKIHVESCWCFLVNS